MHRGSGPNQSARRTMAAFATLVGAVASVLLVATPASADVATTVEFAGETAVTTPFGSNWSLTLELVGQQYAGEGYAPDRVLGPKDGTVSVTVSGIGGTFSAGIPIQEDGQAYVSQPLAQPLLPAGDYQVTAIFSPAAGTGWLTSQTATPATLTITPIALSAHAEILSDPTISARPFIEAGLAGEYVETQGGAPAGTWSFAVEDAGKEVFAATAAQAGGSTEPVRVDIPTELHSGRELTLRTEFLPVAEIAGGVDLGSIAPSTYTTPGSGLLGALATQISFPIWATLALSALIVALVVVVILLGIRLSRRGAPAKKDRAAVPGDPDNVEIVDMEFVGIEPQRDGSGSWSLSDDGEPVQTPDSKS